MFALHTLGVIITIIGINQVAEWLRLRLFTADFREAVRRCEIKHGYAPGTLDNPAPTEEPAINFRVWLEEQYSSSRFPVRLADTVGTICTLCVYTSFASGFGLALIIYDMEADARWLWICPAIYAAGRLSIGLLVLITRVVTGMPPSMGHHVRQMIQTIDASRG